MRLKYNLIQHYKKLSLIIFVVVAISITYVTKYGIKAANQNNIGDFIVTGGTYGIDYEYGDVTYYIQGYGINESAVTDKDLPKSGGIKNLVVKALIIKTSTPLTLSTSQTTTSGIYIEPGNHADLTFNNVNINGSLPVNIPTNIGNPTSLHLTLADGSHNSLQATTNATAHLPGLRCGEGSSLTIDDERRNVDINGNFVAPEQGRVSRDVTLMDGTKVQKGDRLTILDSSNPGQLIVNGGYRASAIGGAAIENSGNMTFNGGQIIARAYGPNDQTHGAGAGIGGGHAGGGTITTVNGGNIEAYGSFHGAGFGGGCTYCGGMSNKSVTYTLTDVILCKTPKSTIAGDMNINGGYLRAEGFTHSNAFGQGCQSTNIGKTIKITGGTLLPVSKSGFYDIGGLGGDVIVTGGSIRLSGPGKLQGKNNDDTYSWGNLEMTTKVFMTKIDLKGYNLPDTLVDSMKMSINGVETNYGMPSYTDEKGGLYFWLPESGSATEVRVDLGIKGSDGKEIPMDSFFVTDAKQDSILKQYVTFSVDNSIINESDRLYKRYDGLSFTAQQQHNFLNSAIAGGINVPIPTNGQLTDISKMSIQSQLLDSETLEPSGSEEIISGTNANVGKYQLIITSTEYANSIGFKDSFWGHRAYYKYAEIVKADSIINTEVKRSKNEIAADQEIELTAYVSPNNKEALTCKAPTGKVQFYINGEKYGDPVELVKAPNSNGAGFEQSMAIMKWTPTDDGGKYSKNGEQVITVEYLGGTNYKESKVDSEKIQVTPVNQGDINKGGTPIKVTDMSENRVVAPGDILDKIYGDDFHLKLEGRDTDNKPIYSSSNEDVLRVDKDGNVHIVGPGEAVITVTRPGNGAYNDATQNITVHAGKKKLTCEWLDILDKYYDGNRSASIDYQTLKLLGIAKEDLQDFINNIEIIATFPKKDVGKYVDAQAKILLSEELAKKYYFEQPNGEKTSYIDVKDEASILPKKLNNNDEKLTVEKIVNHPYTGSEIKPPIIVKDGDKILIEGVDYTVEYKNNVDVGVATVVIKGKGNYESSLETQFNITNINIDINGDGKSDINIDVDGDGKADINIDTDGDGKADINIDTDGDGKADINIDIDGDGKPDINIDVNGDFIADYNIDTNGDGIADKNIMNQKNNHNIVMSDDTTSINYFIIMLAISSLLIMCMIFKHKKYN